jgi:bacteriocin biosynthesis cyclodehydratase domain-containing protein
VRDVEPHDGPARNGIPERPQLAPWFRTVEDGDRVHFEHGGILVTLKGRAVRQLVPALVPLLDGTRTVQSIVETLGTAVEAPIHKALALMAEHGLLLDGPSIASEAAKTRYDDAAVYVASVCPGTTPEQARRELERCLVVVAGTGELAAEVVRVLSACGVSAQSAGLDGDADTATLRIAAPAGAELGLLPRLNEAQFHGRRPWLQVLPSDGDAAVAGPLFVPDQSACHRCFVLRRAANSGYEDEFDALATLPPRAGTPAALTSILAGLAATLALRWLAGADPTVPGTLYAVEVGTPLALTRHRVLRVPRCDVCGVPAAAPPNPWHKAATRAG